MAIIAATPYVSSAVATTHTIDLPDAVAGEIVIIFIQPTVAVAECAGFTAITSFNSDFNRTLRVLAKVSTGPQSTALLDFLFNPVEVIAHAYTISGSYADLTGINFSTTVSGNGFEQPNRYDPPSFTPAGGLAVYNWFAVVTSYVSGGFTAGPTNYTSLLSSKVLAGDDLAFGTAYRTLEASTEDPSPFIAASDVHSTTITFAILDAAAAGPDYTQRKGSTFDATHTLGTITTATLNGVAITINSTGAGTVNLTDTSGITTSGVYNLVLGDGAATETYTVQLNVIGLPAYTLNKNGVALGNLSGIKVLVTATGELDGTQLYSANNLTATAGVMDSKIFLDTGAVADVVTITVLTGANEGVPIQTTVELL
jgi:hypothetical protein